MALNLDRGVTSRKHPSGMIVAMYDDTPGTYLTEKGEPLDPSFARAAGFDVEKDLRRAAANARIALQRKQIEDELKSEEDALAGILSDRSQYDVRHVGGGQYAVFSKTGTKLTRVAMSKADVELMIGPVEDAEPDDLQKLIQGS